MEHTRTHDFKIAYAIGSETMIAAGIFSLSGTAVAEIGSSAVIAFVLSAAVAGLTAASYAEFASIYSDNGGVPIIGPSPSRPAARASRRRRPRLISFLTFVDI